VTRDPRPVTRDPWPVTRDPRPVTRDPWPVTRDPWPVTRDPWNRPAVICTGIGTSVHYWPILARRTRVRVTTRYSEKFKINISSPPYSNETFYTKALEYKEYFTPIDLVWRVSLKVFNFFSTWIQGVIDLVWRVSLKVFNFFSIWSTECLAKRSVNIRLFWFV
jgi:hypothetical protein